MMRSHSFHFAQTLLIAGLVTTLSFAPHVWAGRPRTLTSQCASALKGFLHFPVAQQQPREITDHLTRTEFTAKLHSRYTETPRKKRAFLKKLYGNQLFDYLNERLLASHPELEPVLFDIGIVHFWEEFISFVDQQTEKKDPWQLRAEFSSYLGTKKVYRALALTPQELRHVVTYGMESRLLRNPKRNSWIDADFRLQETYDSHAIGLGSDRYATNSYLMSVSEYPEVSIAVANEFRTPEKDVYLFELNIPLLDIIPLGDRDSIVHPSRTPPSRLRVLYRNQHPNNEVKIQFSKKLESFVLFKINPLEIQSVTPIRRDDPRANLVYDWY